MDPIANAARNAVALPSAPADFAGRHGELALLREEVRRARRAADGSSRQPTVLVVAGRPGSGRTALALKLAGELAGELAGGLSAEQQDAAWYLRLREADGTPVAPEAAAELLLRAAGSALRLPLAKAPDAAAPRGEAAADAGPEPDPEVLGSAARPAGFAALRGAAPGGFAGFALRRALAGRRFVLVLDDVVESAQVEAVLAEDAPEAVVIAVSDGPLVGVAGARPCVVGALEHAAAVQLLVRFAGRPASSWIRWRPTGWWRSSRGSRARCAWPGRGSGRVPGPRSPTCCGSCGASRAGCPAPPGPARNRCSGRSNSCTPDWLRPRGGCCG
ncbi:hypothetical protein ACFQZC_10135 [Streptacidiphilus monticola]